MIKRGQFFLLAAVIISAVIISLGAATNKVIVNDELEDFYVSSDEMRREIAAFLDYAVYEDSVNDNDLEEFLDLLAEDMENENPNVDFAFIYRGAGDSMLKVRNYGSRDFYVNNGLIGARNRTLNTIIDEHGITWSYYKDENVTEDSVDLESVDFFLVRIDEDSEGVSFPFLTIPGSSDYQQVIVVTQKEERGDVYVSIG